MDSQIKLCSFNWPAVMHMLNAKERIKVTLFNSGPKYQLNKWITDSNSHTPTVVVLPLDHTKGNSLGISERDLTVRYGNQQEVQKMLSLTQDVGLRVFVCFLSRNPRSKAFLHKLALKPAALHEIKPQSLFQQGYSLSTSNSSDSPSLAFILKSYRVQSKSDIPILVLPLMDISKVRVLCNTPVSGSNMQYSEQLYQANEMKHSQNELTHPQHNVASSSVRAQILSPSSNTMSTLREDRKWDDLVAYHSASNLANIIYSSSPEEVCLPDVQNYTICHSIVSSPYSQEEIAYLLDLLDKKGMQDLMIVPNNDGDTPLHLAIRRNQASIVSTLLKYLPLSSLQIANNRGLTPLHLIAEEQQWKTLTLLLYRISSAKSDEKDVSCTVRAVLSFCFTISNGHISTKQKQKAATKLSATGPAKPGKSLLLLSQYLDKLRLKANDFAVEGENGNASFKENTSSRSVTVKAWKDRVKEELSEVQQMENKSEVSTDLDTSHSELHSTGDSQCDREVLFEILPSPPPLVLYKPDVPAKKEMCTTSSLAKPLWVRHCIWSPSEDEINIDNTDFLTDVFHGSYAFLEPKDRSIILQVVSATSVEKELQQCLSLSKIYSSEFLRHAFSDFFSSVLLNLWRMSKYTSLSFPQAISSFKAGFVSMVQDCSPLPKELCFLPSLHLPLDAFTSKIVSVKRLVCNAVDFLSVQISRYMRLQCALHTEETPFHKFKADMLCKLNIYSKSGIGTTSRVSHPEPSKSNSDEMDDYESSNIYLLTDLFCSNHTVLQFSALFISKNTKLIASKIAVSTSAELEVPKYLPLLKGLQTFPSLHVTVPCDRLCSSYAHLLDILLTSTDATSSTAAQDCSLLPKEPNFLPSLHLLLDAFTSKAVPVKRLVYNAIDFLAVQISSYMRLQCALDIKETHFHKSDMLCKLKLFSRSGVCTTSGVSHPEPTKWNSDKESKYKSSHVNLLTYLLCSIYTILQFNALFISNNIKMISPKFAVSTTSVEQEVPEYLPLLKEVQTFPSSCVHAHHSLHISLALTDTMLSFSQVVTISTMSVEKEVNDCLVLPNRLEIFSNVLLLRNFMTSQPGPIKRGDKAVCGAMHYFGVQTSSCIQHHYAIHTLSMKVTPFHKAEMLRISIFVRSIKPFASIIIIKCAEYMESYMRKDLVKKSDTITFPIKVDAAVFAAIYMPKTTHQKQFFFRILHVPHDFIHMTSELHVTNPLNYRGENILHIAVDLSGILSFKILLQHDAVDQLIIEPNLAGDTPLHKSARLRNPEVFELLFEESCRSYGCKTIKQKFPKLFEPCFKHFLRTVTVVFKCAGGVTSDAIFCLALKQIHDQWFLSGGDGIISVPGTCIYYYSQKLKQLHVVCANSHGPECISRPGTTGGLDEKLSNGHGVQQCSDTDFKNAVMCHSVRGAYLLYSTLTPNCDCCAHEVEQYVVIPTECSPVPPYLGKKSETLRQGNTSDRCSSYCREQGTKRSDTQAKVAAKGVNEYKTTNLFLQAAHNKMRHKTENHVEADEAVTRSRSRQEQKMSIHVQHFNLAADCLHAQDYVRMLHSLPYCSVCSTSVSSNMSMDHKTQITYLFGCGLAHVKLSKQKEAIRHFQTCESVAAKDERMHRGDIALCNQNLGDILLAKQSFISAAEHYSKAVDYYSSETVAQNFKMIVPSISGLYAKLASALRNASKVVDAVQAYKNAIATAESKKDKLSAHTSLGNLYQSVGENASALKEYEQSIELSEELEDYVSLGWAHGNMGNACLGLYQRDKALYHLDKSLKLALNHEPTPQAIGRAFNNLGTAHQALNEYDKAQENYDLALGQGIYGNDIPGQARVYGNIGNLLMVRQDYERAIPHYTEVLRLSKDRSTVSTAYHNRGCAYYELAESKKTAIIEKRPHNTTFYVHGLECVAEHRPLILPNSITKLYRHGSRDLEEVVRFHEETLNSIKGSTKGLTLSVSLFESNSRTFHRLQDCLVGLGEWKKALVVAEQSRTRTLGELLLKKKEWQLEESLSAPLNLDQITSVVKSQSLPVLYLSYTGARLLGWVLMPDSETIKMGMFEVPMKDDQFEGKSFDYHLRYSLNEVLVEKSFEMYRSCDYSSTLNDPVINLYNLIGKPLCNLLKQLDTSVPQPTIQSVLVIPDSYTNLLPFTCLLATDPKTKALRFLGDQYSFQLMPSLLTMGILDQLPSTTVMIPAESHDMCVVGNPTIPPFIYNGEPWNLGKLPYATKEAQWVAHILGTAPILHEQATKSAVLMRILNSKVIHIATHGSAAAGFLAFAGITSSQNKKEAIESGNVLIYPRDIEKQNISPALVVLSSCDSGRGEVKADGIQGMTRAFILAGAQAVLTTLWRVPDESACVFMQFFYQYLVDGFCGSEALQKAILSVRCFSKYSQYIHWSGYQLTGRKIQFDVRKPGIFRMLETRLGPCSVFPQLDDVKKLELAFINDPRIPTDVQILRGSPGMKPSEPLIDFIHSFHHHFKGGIFWINGRTKELVEASTTYIEKVTGKLLSEFTPSDLDVQQVLVVLDYFEHLPTDEAWIKFLKNPNVHIVVISKHYSPPELLRKEIDHQLLRGCNDINIQPLSMVHTIQRIVHSIHEQHHLAPGNVVQELFEKLAELTSGSPAIIKVASGILLSHMKHDSTPEKVLQEFVESFSLLAVQTTCKVPPEVAESRCISRNVAQNILSVTSACDEVDPWKTDVQYDSWQVVSNIIAGSELSREEQLLLYSLSVFSCCPIPMSVVTEISTLIAKASNKAYLSGNLHSTLFNFNLASIYPTPVILYPAANQQLELETEFVYVPQYLSSGIWKHIMSPVDKAVALGTAFKALSSMSTQDTTRSLEQPFLLGLCSLLLEMFELNYELMGKQCYQEVYKLSLFLSYHVHTQSEEAPGKKVDYSL